MAMKARWTVLCVVALRLRGQEVSISKFSASGKLLARWGGLHLAELPSSIAVAPNGDIFVFGYVIYLHDPSRLALEGDDILRLAPNGRQLGVFKVHYQSTGGGITVDRQENIYLAYGTTPHFEKRSRDGVLLASWGVPQPVYASPSPAAITLDSAGDLFVADTPQSVIEEFGPSGTLLGRWGFPGSYPGQFHQPSGIAFGRTGTIYVADISNHRIQKLER